MKKLQLAIVIWGDAWGSNSWEGMAELIKGAAPLQVTSVGYVLTANKEGVLLAASVTERGSSPLNTFIPRGMIKSIKKLGAKYDHRID